MNISTGATNIIQAINATKQPGLVEVILPITAFPISSGNQMHARQKPQNIKKAKTIIKFSSEDLPWHSKNKPIK